MEHQTISIRPFIGAKNYKVSREFYKDLGFTENIVSPNMCYFNTNGFGFYLQDAYVKDWIDNTMIFMEVADVKKFWNDISALELHLKYENVRLVPIREMEWGRECFLIDPSGILWHFGGFNK